MKKIKVSVRQFADICLFSTAQYKCTVDEKVNNNLFFVNIVTFLIPGVRGWVPPGLRVNTEQSLRAKTLIIE